MTGNIKREIGSLENRISDLEAKLREEFEGTKILQRICSELLIGHDDQSTYKKLLHAAMEIMRSDYASIQKLDVTEDGRQALNLLADIGFSDKARRFWKTVSVSSFTTCGEALRSGRRFIVTDVKNCDCMQGTEDRQVCLRTGIQACQTTPLISGNGLTVGMISTHWRRPHEPAERQLRLLDILARQAADFIECRKAEEALRRAFLRETVLGELTSRLLQSEDPQAVMEDICRTSIDFLKCDVFINYIIEEERLRLNACLGISSQAAENIKYIEIGEAVSGKVYAQGKRIVASHVQDSSDPRLKLIRSLGIQAYASFPLNSTDRIIGTLSFGSKKRKAFTEDDLNLMNNITGHISIALNRLIMSKSLRESERKARALVKELEEADQNKNQFLSILSHELRNPLASITAGLSLLEISSDEKNVSDAREIMQRQVKQLCKLVDDLLDLTRITQNKIQLKKETLQINDLILNIVDDMKLGFRNKGVHFWVKVQAQPVFVYADRVRITQCIGNILTNALKFTQKTGAVWLTLEQEKDDAVIRVRDNGIGIGPEMLSQLFKPFTQSYSSPDRHDNTGLGLGLAIVKHIIEMHGGQVAARSAGIGRGALFTLRLPAAAGMTETELVRARQKPKRSYRILIIDDNSDLTNILCTALGTMGHETYAACSGKAGIKKAREMKPDVIFCEIGLPDKSGYEVAGLIKKDAGLKSAYLVALTGYADKDKAEQAGKSGFYQYLAKPIDMASLEKVISDVENAPGADARAV